MSNSTTIDSSRRLQNKTLLGVLLMIGGLALYPIADALVKHLMNTYPVPQTTFLRAITRLVPLLIATFFQGGPIRVLSTKHPKQHLVRLAVNFAYTYAFMFAVYFGSLTGTYTLGYTSPFFMIILSALLLKETVGKEKWIAVAIGMLGVVVATPPGANLFGISAVLVLVGTFLGALNKILMRKLAATEHSLAIAIYPNLVMICFSFPIVIQAWHAMPWDHWGLFAIMGLITAAGQYAIAQALRYAQASVLAPIDYSTFFWVVSLDYLWWSRTPDLYTLGGAAIIVGSNCYILYRAKREAPAPAVAAVK